MTATAVRERPILFSGEMVRAILEDRKTQTRRVVKLPPEVADRPWRFDAIEDYGAVFLRANRIVMGREVVTEGTEMRCPYGQVGDMLWVRETWGYIVGNGRRVVYRADGPPRDAHYGNVIDGMKWAPSIHLKREHSRITLEITGVRVERLQEISEGDALGEGVGVFKFDGTGDPPTPVEVYAALWDDINGKPRPVRDEDGNITHYVCYPWDEHGTEWFARNDKPIVAHHNPWVWVIEFKRQPSTSERES